MSRRVKLNTLGIVQEFLKLYKYFEIHKFIDYNQVEVDKAEISNIPNNSNTTIEKLESVFRQYLEPIARIYWNKNKLHEFDNMIKKFQTRANVRTLDLSFKFEYELSSNDSESSDSDDNTLLFPTRKRVYSKNDSDDILFLKRLSSAFETKTNRIDSSSTSETNSDS